MQQDLQAWETLIGSRMRPTVCQAIEDPVERNRKEQAKRWQKNNAEKHNEYSRKWKKAHREKVYATQKKWLAANPDKKKLYQERNKKNVKAWAEAHHDRIRELGRASDARRRQTEKRQNWTKEYRQRPEVKERLREYYRLRSQTPERKAYEHERAKRRWAEKKAKKLLQQQGTNNEK